MLEALGQMLSYPFMVRALAVGIPVALCAALLGVSLVLKRFSMIGDGLSHVGFGALAVATVLNAAPTAVAVPVVVAAAFLLLRMSEKNHVRGDAAIALISAGSLALGVMAVSLSGGTNVDVMNYMFGSILALSKADVLLSAVLCGAILVLYAVFYPLIFSITFDENFAGATGTPTKLCNMLLAAMTAVTVVMGMRLMGALLISSLIIFPSLSAMRVFKSFRAVVICSGALAVGGFAVGLALSYLFSTPTGAGVVCVDAVIFGILALIGFIKSRRRGKRRADGEN